MTATTTPKPEFTPMTNRGRKDWAAISRYYVTFPTWPGAAGIVSQRPDGTRGGAGTSWTAEWRRRREHGYPTRAAAAAAVYRMATEGPGR